MERNRTRVLQSHNHCFNLEVRLQQLKTCMIYGASFVSVHYTHGSVTVPLLLAGTVQNNFRDTEMLQQSLDETTDCRAEHD